jgi:hypothetical protein
MTTWLGAESACTLSVVEYPIDKAAARRTEKLGSEQSIGLIARSILDNDIGSFDMAQALLKRLKTTFKPSNPVSASAFGEHARTTCNGVVLKDARLCQRPTLELHSEKKITEVLE